MSAGAPAYYERITQGLGAIDLPPILDGQARLLLGDGPGDRLSLHSLKPNLISQVNGLYGQTLSSLDATALLLGRQEWPETPLGISIHCNQINAAHVARMVPTLLMPRDLSTGYLTDIQIEAITPDDIKPTIIGRALRPIYPTNEVLGRRKPGLEIYLLTSAAFSAGGSLGHAACLSVVLPVRMSDAQLSQRRLVDNEPAHTVIMPRYVGTAHDRNSQLARSRLREARAARTCLDQYNVRNPYAGGENL